MKKYQLFNGNNIDKLRELEDNSIDSIVTDPPYGLSAAKNSGKRSKGGFMGKQWDYDVPSVEVWAECLRVLKPGGHLLAFAGTRTQHRMAVRIEDAGFEIRDMIAWVYGSGFPKSHDVSKAIDKAAGAKREVVGPKRLPNGKEHHYNIGFGEGEGYGSKQAGRYETAPATDAARQWQGWGTALKPALEPITVARKPLIGTVAENVLQHGTGAINVDGGRVAFVSDADRRESTAKNQHAEFGTQPMTNNNVYGDYSMIQPANYNPPGRWPTNFIHDGSDEATDLLKDSARFFYCAKASKRDRDEGLETPPQPFVQFQTANGTSGKASSLSEGRNTEYRNIHPTVKPTDLMRYLCRLVTPPNGIVLDPFMGSGSTGKAAMLEGFKFIGMELDDEYFKIAKARITHINPSDFW